MKISRNIYRLIGATMSGIVDVVYESVIFVRGFDIPNFQLK